MPVDLSLLYALEVTGVNTSYLGKSQQVSKHTVNFYEVQYFASHPPRNACLEYYLLLKTAQIQNSASKCMLTSEGL